MNPRLNMLEDKTDKTFEDIGIGEEQKLNSTRNISKLNKWDYIKFLYTAKETTNIVKDNFTE